MKKGFAIVLALVLIALISFGIYSVKGGNKVYIESSYHNELMLKGIEEANALTFDDEGNIYIALGNDVMILDSNRQKKTLFKENESNIYDIEYYNGKIYYVSKGKLSYYDLDNKKTEIILDNIPNIGDYKESKILLKDTNLYLSIGAATNSGVVDRNDLPKDLTPKKLTLSGRNYNDNKNGPFTSFGIKVEKGQEVDSSPLGNASIVKIDLESIKSSLYCYGVRNVEGIDYNSEGKIFGVVGGIEERGFRALYDDVDYIYELKGDETWYGWPDYSGGDPVSSPRFRGEGKQKVNFILDNHPTFDPPAPFYQHNSINTLKLLAIDREGALGGKDSIFTFDKNRGQVINILKEGAVNNSVKIYEIDELRDMEIYNNELYLLDGENGYLVKIFRQGQRQSDKIIIYIFFMILTISMMVTLVIKLFLDRK